MAVSSGANGRGAPRPKKRLVFCFDGTWNRLDAATPTNVVLTAESIVPLDPHGNTQAIFYDEGVGTGTYDHVRGGTFGSGLVDKLGDAYRFLTFNYSPGDEIYVFGFSRGAFTARSFVGMLRNCGIPSRSQAGRINEAVRIYQSRDPDLKPDALGALRIRADLSPGVCTGLGEDAWRCGNVRGYAAGSAHLLKVRYLGIWDTVGALGVPARYHALRFLNRKYRFHDTNLSAMVESGRHAVAIDERRQDFMPTLWTNADALNRSNGKDPDDPGALYQQRWFPGVHCGVGGGGDSRGLSDQALAWIWEGAQRAGLALDTSQGSRVFELQPDPLAPLSPFNVNRLTWFGRFKNNAMNLIWRRGDRPGPTILRDVAPSARRRWHTPAELLPEKRPYRPAPLARLAPDLDALQMAPTPAAGSFDLIHPGPGETLRSIALRELGDAEQWEAIFALNQDRLDDPNHIFCGSPLRIPKRTGEIMRSAAGSTAGAE